MIDNESISSPDDSVKVKVQVSVKENMLEIDESQVLDDEETSKSGGECTMFERKGAKERWERPNTYKVNEWKAIQATPKKCKLPKIEPRRKKRPNKKKKRKATEDQSH